jgi:hypothetical protein
MPLSRIYSPLPAKDAPEAGQATFKKQSVGKKLDITGKIL